MFKNIFLFSLVLLTFSCSVDETNTTKASSTNCMVQLASSNNPFINLAAQHNQLVENIYNDISIVQQSQLPQEFKNSATSNGYVSLGANHPLGTYFQGQESLSEVISNADYLPKKLKIYLHDMSTIIDNDNDVIADLQTLEDEIIADNTLSTNEANALLQGIAIGQGSYCYWTNNYQKWIDLGNPSKLPDPVKDVIKADAISGGVTGALIYLTIINPPAGITGTAATLTTAGVTSALTGAWHLGNYILDTFTDWW